MKKILLLSALMTALTSAGALAADANINFNGTVSANTCTLNAADASKVLTLPNVSASSLNAVWPSWNVYTVSGSFSFSACPAGLTKVTSNYTYQGSLVAGTTTTAIPTGTATNVGIQLQQSSTPNTSRVVPVNGTSGTNNEAAITANAATVPVTVAISGVSASNTQGMPTVGTYTGTYTVAFTYS